MSHLIKNSGLRPRKKEIRDFSYKRYRAVFGAAVFIPKTESYDLTPSWVPILDQGSTDMCTAFSLAIGKSVVEGRLISPEWQFKETKRKEGSYLSYGADPVDAIKAMQGGALEAELSPFKTGVNDRNQIANPANWPAHLDEAAKIIPSGAWFRPNGQKDLFDSIREVLQAYGTKAIVVIDLYWQPHWTFAPGGVINYDGIYDEVNAHQVYTRAALKVIDGNPYLVGQNSYKEGVGDKGLFYFDRKTVNLFNKYSGGAKVLLDADPAEVKKATWSVLQRIADFLYKLLAQINTPPLPTNNVIEETKIIPDETAPEPVKPTPQPMPKYLWDTPANARHSVRLICDEKGLSVDDKNLLCQVISCESGFKIDIVHPNNDPRKTTDYGICQFNDYWYRDLITPEESLNNPEKAVRLMIQQFKKGRLKDWVCYSSGIYKKSPA